MKCNKEMVCIQEIHSLIWTEVGKVRVPEKQGEDPTISSWLSQRGAVPMPTMMGQSSTSLVPNTGIFELEIT